MKKILLVVLAISMSFAGYSQKSKVTAALSYIASGELDKAKSALDEALANDKSKNLPNTYYAKGLLCQSIFDADDEKYASYYANPLEEAYAAYEKAISLDPKGAIQKKMITGMVYNRLVRSFGVQAYEDFDKGQFAQALKSFDKQIQIMESNNFVGGIDTSYYFNAGLTAMNAKDYQAGIKYFQKCADLGYQSGNSHISIAQCYNNLGQADKAEQYLLSLPDKYPNDPEIITTLIDGFNNIGKPEQAIKFLDLAIANDPTNYILYYVGGVSCLNTEDYLKAIDFFTKAYNLNRDGFDTNNGLGAAYINYANDVALKANDIVDIAEYNAAVDEANDLYKKAVPYMEKALEIEPSNVNVMNLLKELYFRLRQVDSSMTSKYNDITAKINALQ